MTMSCQPARTSAYSEDLRWRRVWQSELLGYSQQAIAQNLGVDQSTVSRTIQLFQITGCVGKKPYPKEKTFRKLTAPCQLLIITMFFSTLAFTYMKYNANYYRPHVGLMN